jgi:hypothetical protein
MWIITQHGFISAVAYDPKRDGNKRSKRQLKLWGGRPILARARVENHLEQIRPFFPKLKIEKDDSADYEFRAIVSRRRWNAFLEAAGDAIDYDSHFKEIVRERSPGTKAEKDSFYAAMLKVWNNLADVQPDAPYSGLPDWTSYGKSGWTYGASGTGSGSGYTKSGVKSAAESAAILGSAQTFKGSESAMGMFAGRSGYWDTATSKWVETGGGSDYADFEAADTVEAMAKQLMLHSPNFIDTDEGTTAAAYNLWLRAGEEFNRPLNPTEVMDILEELLDAKDVTVYDANCYSALLDKLYSTHLGVTVADLVE